jgi:hypothetical protein
VTKSVGERGRVVATPGLYSELLALVTAVWFEIDHEDGSAVSSHFTPDGELTFSERTFRGRDAIDAVYRHRGARGPRVSRHVVTNMHVRSANAESASAVSTLLLFAQDGRPPLPATAPTMVGDVHDRFHHSEDGWLIASRRIEIAFIVPGDVLAVPVR